MIDETRKDMILKRFTYDITKLVRNSQVTSATYKYEVNMKGSHSPGIFPILSIDLPLDVGTSVSEIMGEN